MFAFAAGRAGVRGRALATIAVLALLACGSDEDGASRVSHEAVALADQEDAVCGMLVREQSAPRAQVVHRDGSRFFFCSLGDLLVHLRAPSPHGAAESIFVEVLTADENPMKSHRGPHPWRAADDAFYVVGVPRGAVMGEPILSYASSAEADEVAAAHPGARALGFAELRAWWKGLESAP